MFTVSVPNELSELETLTSSLQKNAVAEGLSETLQHRLLIIAEELFVNFVHHGAAVNGKFEVKIEKVDDDVVVQLSDDGPPFDPLNRDAPDVDGALDDRKEGGLGIHLVKEFASDVAYRRTDSQNVVTVRLSEDDLR